MIDKFKIFNIDEAKWWIMWKKWLKKFSLHAHYHIIPEPIPSQKHILQELLDEQVKALNPSQTAEKKQTYFRVIIQHVYQKFWCGLSPWK